MAGDAWGALRAVAAEIEALAVGDAPGLRRLVTAALAVPPPVGQAQRIVGVADALAAVGGRCGGVADRLVGLAGTAVPMAWGGARATDATVVFRRVADDLRLLPQAFTVAATALRDWAGRLTAAQRQAAQARAELMALRAGLRPECAPVSRAPGSGGAVGGGGWRELNPTEWGGARGRAAAATGSLAAVAAGVATDGAAVAATLAGLVSGEAVGPAGGPARVLPSAAAAFRGLGAPAPAGALAGGAQAAAAVAADLRALDHPGTALTDADRAAMARLEQTFARYAGDRVFACALLTHLGPDGLLRSAEAVAHLSVHTPSGLPVRDGPTAVSLAHLQTGLGLVLATGTNAAGRPRMASTFTARLRALAKRRYGDHTGHQVIGALLHAPGATFDPDFVIAFGEDVLRAEHGDGTVWRKRGVYGHSYPASLIDRTGDGSDPMTGVMVALSRDPQAAAAFLDPRRSDHLRYLLTQRTWPVDDTQGARPASLGDHAALGLVVEAATRQTGDPVSRDIAARTIQAVGGPRRGGGLDGAVPDGMRPALTDVLVRYIGSGDVDAAFGSGGGQGGLLNDPPDGSPWTTADPPVPPGGEGGRTVGLRALDTTLRALAADNDGYTRLTTAELAHTQAVLRAEFAAQPPAAAATPGTRWDAARHTADTSAHVVGVLTRSQETALPTHPDATVPRVRAVAHALVGQLPTDRVPVAGDLAASWLEDTVDRVIDQVAGDREASDRVGAAELHAANYDDLVATVNDTVISASGADPATVHRLVTADLGVHFATGYAGLDAGQSPKEVRS